MGLEMGAQGSISADVRHKAAPPGPPQPTGPRGPLGPCPAGLAPGMAVQAPKPHPIRPLAGSAGLVGSGSVRSYMGGHTPPTQPRWWWLVSTPPGVLGGHWGGLGRVGLAHRAPRGLNPWAFCHLSSGAPWWWFEIASRQTNPGFPADFPRKQRFLGVFVTRDFRNEEPKIRARLQSVTCSESQAK